MEWVSERAKRIKSSPTLALAAKAKEMASTGKDVISLSVGEPDWPTLEVASRAAISAIQNGFTKYTPANGTPEIRKAISKALQEETGQLYSDSEVTVTAGGKFTIFSALHAVLNEGDEVIIPAPYWVSYPTMVEMLSAVPVIPTCSAGDGFKLNGENLKKHLTSKTKMLILNSPSNPTGAAYSEAELRALAAVLKAVPQALILSDDIYNRLMFDGSIAPHILKVAPELRERTLVINGASKSFSMTGWRVGWAAGPAAVIKAMNNYQSQTVSCAAGPSLEAARSALESGAPELKKAIGLLVERLEFCMGLCRTIPRVRVDRPHGAFYLWMDVSQTFGKSSQTGVIRNSSDFSSRLLEEKLVAVVPGVEFGAEGFVRLSFALKQSRMEEALRRIADFTEKLI